MSLSHTTATPQPNKRKIVQPNENDKSIDHDKSTDQKPKRTRTSTSKKTVKSPVASGICQVCCESFNSTSNALVGCPRCPYQACKSCHQTYLLSSISTPHCMNCRNRWTYKDLLTLFNQSFVTKTFRKQRGTYLLDRAKSHLPLAMPYATIETELRKLNAIMKPLGKEYSALRREVRYNLYPSLTPVEREKKFAKYADMGAQLMNYEMQRRALWRQSYQYRSRRSRGHADKSNGMTFEEPCPVNDCRGFIEKNSQRCGICKIFVCRKCTKVLGKVKEEPQDAKVIASTTVIDDDELNQALAQIDSLEREDKFNDDDKTDDNNDVNRDHTDAHTNAQPNDMKQPNDTNTSTPEDEETLLSASNLSPTEKKELRVLKKAHTCKQEDIDSIKEIRQHSRACPSCKSRIFRISGCDTMWCTRCNTGFNWRTGLIIKNAQNLHNPHYLDFVRNNPDFKYSHQQGQGASSQPQAPIDNPCDVLTLETIVLPEAHSVNSRTAKLDTVLASTILNFQQQMLHVRDYARAKFLNGNVYDEVNYALRFITKQWDEKRWRIMVEHHDRFRQTNQEYVDVIMTWLVVMNDLFATHLPRVPLITNAQAKPFIDQLRHISEYTNNTLAEMNTMYKRKTTLIVIPEIKLGYWETFMNKIFN